MSIQTSLNDFRVIKQGSTLRVRRVLREADWNLIKAITEIAYNIVKGNVELKRGIKKQLGKYSAAINRIADLKISYDAKKKYLLKNKQAVKILKLMIKAVKWLNEWL